MSQPISRRGFVAASVAIAASAAAAQTGAAVEQDVRAKVQALADAFLAADAERLSKLIHTDYIHTNTGGSVVNKQQWLTFIRSRRAELDSGALKISRYENQNVEVRMHGGVAIVTGVNVSEGVRQGAQFARTLRFTQVWSNSGDSGWVRVAFHDCEVTR
jgi:ketosteroid isomerase-like protein